MAQVRFESVTPRPFMGTVCYAQKGESLVQQSGQKTRFQPGSEAKNANAMLAVAKIADVAEKTSVDETADKRRWGKKRAGPSASTAFSLGQNAQQLPSAALSYRLVQRLGRIVMGGYGVVRERA